METLFEHAGGEKALHRFIGIFYRHVLADPLPQPLFGKRKPDHVDHLTAFAVKSFAGPDRFSREIGFSRLIKAHRGLRITHEQRQRFVELHVVAADEAGLPNDPPFRQALREHAEFRIARRHAEFAPGHFAI
jgi:hemoglobin